MGTLYFLLALLAIVNARNFTFVYHLIMQSIRSLLGALTTITNFQTVPIYQELLLTLASKFAQVFLNY